MESRDPFGLGLLLATLDPEKSNDEGVDENNNNVGVFDRINFGVPLCLERVGF